MRTSFFGFEIGRRALQAQQRALDVVGHNIANANTPGYSRQMINLTATEPYEAISAVRSGQPGQVGTGVTVETIKRFRDAFLDRQYRSENNSAGKWETRQQALHELEVIFAEPTDAGLRSVINQFWQSLQDLSNDPESSSARALVVQRGAALTDDLTHLHRQISDLRTNIDKNIANKVQEINLTAQQIASLNYQIANIKSTGDNPNDLMDKRGVLLDQLSKQIDISFTEFPDGSSNVMVRGVPLVEGAQANSIGTSQAAGVTQLTWKQTGTPVEVTSGEIGAMIALRDQDLKGYLDKLDTLAKTFADAFNAVHASGYGLDNSTGRAFFTDGTAGPLYNISASNIQVNPAILADQATIAASSSLDGAGNVNRGDGRNALALADLKKSPLYLGSASLSDYYESIISDLGVSAQAANRMTDNQQILLKAIDNQRQIVSGVSLDEEMINMVKYQQGYNAAAKLMKTMDEMMNTLINGMI